MTDNANVPRITLHTEIPADAPQSFIDSMKQMRELDGASKEAALKTLARNGITAQEIAAHLGMTEEELLSDEFDFPLDVYPEHVESAIRKAHTQHIGAGIYSTRIGGHTYTIGGKVTLKVFPRNDPHWHEIDDWETTLEAVVYQIRGGEVQLMPVITYEPGTLELMDFEEWQARQAGFSGSPVIIKSEAAFNRFGTRNIAVVRSEQPREQDKPTVDEFRNADFTCLFNMEDTVSPMDWRRMHALNGWISTQGTYTE